MDDGRVHTSGNMDSFTPGGQGNVYGKQYPRRAHNVGSSGSFNRFFDLDRWWKMRLAGLPENVRRTFPFLIVPKASKREKESGLGKFPPKASSRRVSPEASERETSRRECHIVTHTRP